MVVFTAAVTLSTAVYAILTGVLVAETRRMRQVQTEPRIEITLRPFESAINIVRLHIKNIGLGPAVNVKFKPRVISGEEGAKKLLAEFTETNFFTTGLKYIGPGQEVYSHYTQMHNDHDQKILSVLIFEIEYKSVTGKIFKENTIIDMSEIKGQYQLGTPNLYSIARSLEKIQRDIGQIKTVFKNIDISNREDRESESKQELK